MLPGAPTEPAGELIEPGAALVGAIRGGAPAAPQVQRLLDGARLRRDELERQVAEANLDALTGDAVAEDHRQHLAGDLAATSAEIERLETALEVALQRDQRREAETELKVRRDGLAEFQRVTKVRATAAADLDRAAAAIVDAWNRLQAAEHLVRMSLPNGCALPPGYHGVRLQDLAANTVYRQHTITGIGDDRLCFPGAKPPDMNTRFNPRAIASATDVIGDQNRWLERHLGAQVEAFAEIVGLAPAPEEAA
jgi:hypothetical protein